MIAGRFRPLIPGLFMVFVASLAVAAEGMVVGVSPDIRTLELYKTPTDEKPADKATAAELSLPTPILAVSNNGMFKIAYKGAEYWVISDDVTSDMTRKVDTSCDPKIAGSVVAHGKRGAGEGCQ